MQDRQVANSDALFHTLEATGYLDDGQAARGVLLGETAGADRRWRSFEPDARWESNAELRVYFKTVPSFLPDSTVSEWRKQIWNDGRVPLLVLVSAKEITLYDGFRRPTPEGDAEASRLRTFRHIASQLKELNLFAGRIAMETGQFWHHASAVRSTERVDDQLLLDLGRLEDNLLAQQLPRDQAQALIGRTVFCQYLIDRNIIDATRLSKICGARTLATALRDQNSVERLFRWLRLTFNGDMFGESGLSANLSTDHYKTVSHFLDGVNPDTGQLKLFPYQFDIIPVTLVSSIYERFAKSDKLGASSGIHFTRLPLVSFILDEVLDRLNGRETVLDLTCGSGVFLVEALRRLVRRKSPDGQPSRQLVRTTLYEQIYGVDLSESAIRVASFSLYLAVAGT